MRTPVTFKTDSIRVDLTYHDKAATTIDYDTATKAMQTVLKDTSKFQDRLHDSLGAGANHICGVEFGTSELRKRRDPARALAVKAATEKAFALASAAGLKVADKPLTIVVYSCGGGAF